jgi:hypothetical protein
MKQLIGQRVTICYGVSDSTGVGNIVGDIIDDVNGWLHVRVVSLHGSGNSIMPSSTCPSPRTLTSR